MKYFFDKEILVVGESNELHDKICSPNFVMTCSNVVYTILCANSKDVFWSKMKAKIRYFFDKEILVVGESNELHDKICSPNFVMTCSNVVYTILCANSKDVFWSKMKAKIRVTKKL
ncbi:hypothetical protein C923_05092 [Plasmodium falciparum UGT5.1]|uniref:Uncharacterized protein n=1 Tax=Plasmodium falciparum UGT5.1 TaxID=1237627 RepID=W7JRP9_PLAFA|nr:hypothetical protein C923_05092 [Plasmodium falciparum UGT5.1]